MKSAKFTSFYKTAKKYSDYTVNVIFGVVFAISFALLLILGIPVFIFRSVLIRLAKCLRPDLGNILNPISATMAPDLYSSKKPPRDNLVIPVTLDGRISEEEFKKLVLDRLVKSKETTGELKYPQFSQFPVSWLGFMFWKTDEGFDIKNHVHSHRNENGEPTTDKDYDDLMENLLNAPHHPNRSPWEFHILHNFHNPKLHSGEMSVFIFKVHHCVGDGYSLLHAFAEALAGHTEFQLPKVRTPTRDFWDRLGYTLAVPFTGAVELGRIQREIFVDSPWKIPVEEKAWHQFYGKSELIPIDHIKHIKNFFGVSFTSVILSAISSGIYKNLQEKRLNGTIRVKNEVDKMLCMSVLPLPSKKGMGRLTNNATGAMFHIPSGGFRNSMERLQECDKILERTKNSVWPMLFAKIVSSVGSHCRWVSGSVIRNRMVSTGLTNFPCYGDDFFGKVLGRKPLFNEFAAGGLEGVTGVAFMVASCRGNVRVAVTAEKGLLSRDEVDSLVKCVEDEIRRLYSLSNSNNDNEPVQNAVLSK